MNYTIYSSRYYLLRKIQLQPVYFQITPEVHPYVQTLPHPHPRYLEANVINYMLRFNNEITHYCNYGSYMLRIKRNKVHSNCDLPALIYKTGDRYWYKFGICHRNDLPAIILANGTKYWYQFGRIHRDNEPAVIASDGTKYWYQFGLFHRDDGPAIERLDGKHEWYEDGILIKKLE